MAKLPQKVSDVIQVGGECLQFSHFGSVTSSIENITVTWEKLSPADSVDNPSNWLIPA